MRGKYGAVFGEVAHHRSLPPPEARRDIGERLLSQLRYFGSRADALPEWREAAKARTAEDLWRIWPALPILAKKDLNTRFAPEEVQRRFGLAGRANSTGGSTGEPTRVFHDDAMVHTCFVASIYMQREMGWRPGMPILSIWGSDRDIGKEPKSQDRLRRWLRQVWPIAGFEVNEKTVDAVLEFLRRHRTVAMLGYSSLLESVARQVLKRGDLPPVGRVHTAWNGGEMLFDFQSDLFRQAFGVPVLNCYGGRELSAMAYQVKPGGPLWVVRPFLFVEIVDDAGKPVPPGEPGRLLWTSTVCRGTPFLRYDIGDVAVSDGSQQDESGIRSLKELQGRTAGVLHLPNGKMINCIFWNHLFKEFQEIEQFQVALQKDGAIQLRFKGTPFTQEREAALRQILSKFLVDIPVTVLWTERIPLTKEGKLVQVVRES
jgi:phenylacetate-CoA ligase